MRPCGLDRLSINDIISRICRLPGLAEGQSIKSIASYHQNVFEDVFGGKSTDGQILCSQKAQIFHRIFLHHDSVDVLDNMGFTKLRKWAACASDLARLLSNEMFNVVKPRFVEYKRLCTIASSTFSLNSSQTSDEAKRIVLSQIEDFTKEDGYWTSFVMNIPLKHNSHETSTTLHVDNPCDFANTICIRMREMLDLEADGILQFTPLGCAQCPNPNFICGLAVLSSCPDRITVTSIDSHDYNFWVVQLWHYATRRCSPTLFNCSCFSPSRGVKAHVAQPKRTDDQISQSYIRTIHCALCKKVSLYMVRWIGILIKEHSTYRRMTGMLQLQIPDISYRKCDHQSYCAKFNIDRHDCDNNRTNSAGGACRRRSGNYKGSSSQSPTKLESYALSFFASNTEIERCLLRTEVNSYLYERVYACRKYLLSELFEVEKNRLLYVYHEANRKSLRDEWVEKNPLPASTDKQSVDLDVAHSTLRYNSSDKYARDKLESRDTCDDLGIWIEKKDICLFGPGLDCFGMTERDTPNWVDASFFQRYPKHSWKNLFGADGGAGLVGSINVYTSNCKRSAQLLDWLKSVCTLLTTLQSGDLQDRYVKVPSILVVHDNAIDNAIRLQSSFTSRSTCVQDHITRMGTNMRENIRQVWNMAAIRTSTQRSIVIPIHNVTEDGFVLMACAIAHYHNALDLGDNPREGCIFSYDSTFDTLFFDLPLSVSEKAAWEEDWVLLCMVADAASLWKNTASRTQYITDVLASWGGSPVMFHKDALVVDKTRWERALPKLKEWRDLTVSKYGESSCIQSLDDLFPITTSIDQNADRLQACAKWMGRDFLRCIRPTPFTQGLKHSSEELLPIVPAPHLHLLSQNQGESEDVKDDANVPVGTTTCTHIVSLQISNISLQESTLRKSSILAFEGPKQVDTVSSAKRQRIGTLGICAC